MKYFLYVVTFLGYCTLHMMRMGLPFVQKDLETFFGINNFQMGLANGILYLIIGSSCIYLTLSPIKNPQFRYFYQMMISTICYLIIPLLVWLNVKIPILLYISLAGFGWFQGIAWPVLLAFINVYFDSKKDGCLVGLWSANKDTGNVLGFFVSTILIIFLKLPFQTGLTVLGILSVLVTFLVYKLDIGRARQKIQEDGVEHIKQEYKKIFTDKFIVFMLVMVCMLKAIIYGILLWLPMYFDKSGFKEYQGYIPIAMNIMGVMGSSMLGMVYQKISSRLLKSIILMITFIIPVACFFMIRNIKFSVENRIVLLLLIGIIGFCVSGNYNIVIANEVNLACKRLDINVVVFSGLSMGLGSIFVGITSIIIGEFATSDSNSVFMIFMIMAIILIVFEIIREIVTFYSWRSQKKENGNEELNQNQKGIKKQLYGQLQQEQ